MKQFDELISAGMDINALTKRLLGNTALIGVFIGKFTEDKTFVKLQEAFQNQDAEAAERASHTLKGMCANLSLTELYSLFTQQVNLLRSGEYEKASAMMDTISTAYGKTLCHMQRWCNG